MTSRNEKIFKYTNQGIFLKKIEELENTMDKTVWILKHFPKTRDSDNMLMWEFWLQNDRLARTGIFSLEGEMRDSIILGFTKAESISRCRRKIQNDLGLYLPTKKEIIKGREISEKAVREWSKRCQV